jgi:diadenosine tetraphosphate (Ap4A) HIT family hydrolase
MSPRRRIDFEAVRSELAGRCFICELLAGNPEYAHQVVYEDELAIAFLQRFQTLYGYVLVAPKEHREQVVADFSEDEYLELQRVIHLVGRALCRAVPTERLYVLSLGSQEGNRHVHWHLAPLPPGVPFEEQQLVALDSDLGLVLDEVELKELAARIRERLAQTGKDPAGA